MRGLLAPLNDPEEMARIQERWRIIQQIAKQSGLPLQEAREALFSFESVTSSEGQVLH
jgi:hypothetical protein